MKGKNSGNKKTRGLLSIVFSRTTVVILLLLIQILAAVFLVLRLREKYMFIHLLMAVMGLCAVVYIVNGKSKAEFKLAWIIPILVFPVFGTLFYVYAQIEGTKKVLEMGLKRTHHAVSPYMKQNTEITDNLRRANPAHANLANYAYTKLGYPIHDNTTVKYFPLGEDFFDELMHQLEGARKFIFMEYFIVSKGYMWAEILDVLKEKVAEGVEVRFMYDGMNVISQLPYGYPAHLEKYGIKARMFSPLKPVLSTYHNNRDHRKICVVDGVVGFTGGPNLADEYINRKERFGHWKDTAVMLNGNAVQNLTMMFLEMWNVSEKKPEPFRRYLTPVGNLPVEGTGYVLPFGDNPFNDENIGERVYFHMLEHAKKYVHIMTPYLVLDDNMLSHLTYAAKSGIEVIIIMPHIPDKLFAFALAKTYYYELIEAGVKIYEYLPGFVHAKVFSSDGESAVVGTINCDYRSLFLHFECAVFMYRNSTIWDVEADFQETLKKCKAISLLECKQEPLWFRVMGRILRLFAPLL